MPWLVFFITATGELTLLTQANRPLKPGESRKTLAARPVQEDFFYNPVTQEWDLPRPPRKPFDHLDNDRVQHLIDKPKVQAFLTRLTPQQRQDLKDAVIEVFNTRFLRYTD